VHVNGFVGMERITSRGLCFVGGGSVGLLEAGNCFAEQLEQGFDVCQLGGMF
jgi:hypothetical protein